MGADGLRRVDHVALLVRSVDAALPYWSAGLGLPVVDDAELPQVGVRIAFVDAGNVLIQLVEPIAPGPLRDHLERYGEGLHHLCFGVDDVGATAAGLTEGEPSAIVAGWRGRPATFLPATPNGVRIELTEDRQDGTT